ncbi:apolipoprotein N-acyltransferase [Trichothermofontia sp.]
MTRKLTLKAATAKTVPAVPVMLGGEPDQGGGRSLLWVLLAGGSMAMAIAPLNLWLFAWVALTPLWVLGVGDRAQTPLKAGLLGLGWGIAYHGISLLWIRGLHPLMWLGVPWWGSVAIAGFCWVFVTLWGAALAGTWAMAMASLPRLLSYGQRPGVRVLTGTALWLGLEWLWSQGPLWWTALALTQSPGNPVILHLGQWSGPGTVAAAIVAVNGCLAEAWLERQGENRPGRGRLGLGQWLGLKIQNSKFKIQNFSIAQGLGMIALMLLLTSHAIGLLTWVTALPDMPSTALRVGIVQGNIPTRIKLTPMGIQQAFQHYTAGYEQLADRGVDAVLMPEGAFPLLWEGKQRTENRFYQAVRDRGVVAWLGTFTTQQGHLTQNLLTLGEDGETVGQYDKVKLVPLGEYIPFQHWLGRLINRLSPIEATMVPGSLDQQMATPFGPAIASICYESTFAELFRRQADHGGQFILTASNLDPYSQQLMAQHEAQDVMRAIETDRWAVRATNTGYSGVINPRGKVMWRSQPNRYQVQATPIYRRTTQTPYVRWGDWLTPLLGLLTLSVQIWGYLIHRLSPNL